VPLVFDRLVHGGRITVGRAIELLSTSPARVLNLPGGSLGAGAPADIVVIDPDRRITIDAGRQVSKSKNTPFHGWELRGAVAYTLVGGRIVHRSV
jgi:dihydroorotase